MTNATEIESDATDETRAVVPEGKYADIGDGLHIHYHDHGEGFPVVFLHGSGPGASGWSNFNGNYPWFAERGYRAIVPDSLGFGYSSKPDVDYELALVAGGVERLLGALGVDEFALVGNSHGGALSIRLALTHPSRVRKLVLMAPGGLEERERYMQMAGIRAMMKAFFAEGGITRDSMREVFGLQLYDPAHVTDAIIEQRYQIARLQPKRVLSTLRVPYLAPRLAELSCPVFGLWGMDDQFLPASGATTMASSIADARVLLLSRCGHWVMVEHANLFNRMCVDFLDE